MIPNNINNSDIQYAIKEIDKNGVPFNRNSYIYFLVIEGKEYPPKYVISVANKIKTGRELRAKKFTAVEAKNYFRSNGYKIRELKTKIRKIVVVDEDEEKYYSEGKEKYALHIRYERDTKVAKLAKKRMLENTGELRCEVCDFSFTETYGSLGIGYIEAHHKIPVGQLGDNGRTKIEDIGLLCSNCHRIIHRNKEVISLEKLKDMMNSKII